MAQASSAARRRLERHKEGGGNGGTRTVNLPEGVKFLEVKSADPRRIDILEYKVTEDHNKCADVGNSHFERTYFLHGQLGVDRKGVAICRNKTFGEPCPICEYLNTLDWNKPEEKAIKQAMKAKERQIFNVYDVTDSDKGVQVWDVSYHLFGKQLDAELANADAEDGVDHFDSKGMDGKTLKIAFTQKSMGGHDFYEVSAIGFKNRTVDHSNTATHNLDLMIGHPTYEEVKAIMNGSSAKAEETEEAPAPKAEAQSAAKSEAFACPGGGTYGKDCDKFGDVCVKCPKWDACDDATNGS